MVILLLGLQLHLPPPLEPGGTHRLSEGIPGLGQVMRLRRMRMVMMRRRMMVVTMRMIIVPRS
jgi:hypothetical protein